MPSRYHRRVVPLVSALSLGVALARVAWAEPTAVAEAERAYADVDFDRAHELSSEALQDGGHSVEETRRLYTLLGISGAALGREDVARRAFVRVLLSDPDSKLDQSLSPKIRAPYLEARGEWASATSERGLRATFRIEGDDAVIALFDPMNAVESVLVSLERSGSSERQTKRYPRKSEFRLQVGAVRAYELKLLDEHGNTLWEASGDVKARRTTSELPVRTASTELAAPDPTPYYVVAGAFGITAVGAGVGGALYFAERERLANEWNSSACEEPGSTRAEQCAGVDQRRERAELYSAGLFALSGTFLVAGLVTLAIAPGTREERRDRARTVHCDPTLGVFGLACHGRF
jgi:hypothetical protein